MKYICLLGVLMTFTPTNSLQGKRSAHCPLHDLKIENGSYRLKSGGVKLEYQCNRGYVLYGAETLYCIEGSWNNKRPKCITDTCHHLQITEPLQVRAEHNGALLRFSCAVMTILEGPEVITCNGLTWSDHLPICKPSLPSLSCDFEDPGLCGWTHHEDSDVKWILHKGSTKSKGTGPDHDHTFSVSGKGRYMYFETSSPTRTGHKAVLVSPLYPANYSRRCFSFWYHLYAERRGTVAQLQVFIRLKGSALDDLDPVFSVKENKGRDWLPHKVLVPRLSEPFQILFVATKGTSVQSDIAVDDVRLDPCPDLSSSSKKQSTPLGTSSTIVNHQIIFVNTLISEKKISSTPPTVVRRSTTLKTMISTKPEVNISASDRVSVTKIEHTTQSKSTITVANRRTTLVNTSLSEKKISSSLPIVASRSTPSITTFSSTTEVISVSAHVDTTKTKHTTHSIPTTTIANRQTPLLNTSFSEKEFSSSLPTAENPSIPSMTNVSAKLEVIVSVSAHVDNTKTNSTTQSKSTTTIANRRTTLVNTLISGKNTMISAKPTVSISSTAFHLPSGLSVSARSENISVPSSSTLAVTKETRRRSNSQSMNTPERIKSLLTVTSTSAVKSSIVLSVQPRRTTKDILKFSAQSKNSEKSSNSTPMSPDFHVPNKFQAADEENRSSKLTSILVGTCTGVVIVGAFAIGVVIYCQRRRRLSHSREPFDAINPLYSALDAEKTKDAFWS